MTWDRWLALSPRTTLDFKELSRAENNIRGGRPDKGSEPDKGREQYEKEEDQECQENLSTTRREIEK